MERISQLMRELNDQIEQMKTLVNNYRRNERFEEFIVDENIIDEENPNEFQKKVEEEILRGEGILDRMNEM